MAMVFTEQQMLRYARHIVLPEVGGIGQARLLAARVLLIGAGGLGSPLLLYLAAAGVGTLGVVDSDRVELANLQRQIAHPTARIGTAKTESAAQAAQALNPEIRFVGHALRLGPDNADGLIEAYDLVADGSDNFATRATVHAACLRLGKTLVSAAVQGLEGQLTTYKAHLGPPHPCYRCLFPEGAAAGPDPDLRRGRRARAGRGRARLPAGGRGGQGDPWRRRQPVRDAGALRRAQHGIAQGPVRASRGLPGLRRRRGQRSRPWLRPSVSA